MQDDTVNAAAVVLAAAARSNTGLLPHHQQGQDHDRAATKTRWWSRLKAKLLCFGGPNGHPRRIADYASPEPAHSSSASYHTHHATRPAAAFVAPPSSPASSLLTSESPSPVVELLRLNASSYSSPTASIFAVGPYAREPQQLVSPPAFSAGLTEPSTAPLTPPPEPGCCLQPGSSPEVPFARFLSPSCQGYQLQPGSPIGEAIVSPVSTSSEVPFARFSSPSFQGYQLQPGSPIGDAILSPVSTSSEVPFARFLSPSCQGYQLQPGNPIGDAIVSPVSTSSSPPAWMHRCSEEGSPPSGEFVFGGAAGEWTTFADGEDGGRGASISMGDEAAEDGNPQWPFCSSFRNQHSAVGDPFTSN